MWKPVLKTSQNNLSCNKLFSCAIILTALFFSLPQNASANEASGEAKDQTAGKAIKVKTATYKDIAIHITHTLGGVVPAKNNSRISAQISAVIKQFHVDTGYEVKQGDDLVTLECRENHLRLKQARASLQAEKAQLTNARSQFSQAKKLSKQGNISKEIFNQREAEENRLKATVENRRAAIALAQINVERCHIKAPFDGYITRRDASVGELTQPGTVLLQLVSKTNDIVEVTINNRLLKSFSQGKNYRFEFGEKSYPLKVKFILPVLDKATRNHIARLSFVSEHAITGSVGKVKWQESAASIPSRYIVSRNNKLGILVAENNTAKFIEIKDAYEGQPAYIALDDESRIITQGRFNVKDGNVLNIVNQN